VVVQAEAQRVAQVLLGLALRLAQARPA